MTAPPALRAAQRWRVAWLPVTATVVVAAWHLVEERGATLAGTGLPFSAPWALAVVAAVAGWAAGGRLGRPQDGRKNGPDRGPDHATISGWTASLGGRWGLLALGSAIVLSASAVLAMEALARETVALRAGAVIGIAVSLLAMVALLAARVPAPPRRRWAVAALVAAALLPGLADGAVRATGGEPRLVGVGILWSAGVVGAAAGLVARTQATRSAGLRLPAVALVVTVVAIWLAHDLAIVGAGSHLYDLRVYVAAGSHALAGEPVYLQAPLDALPAIPSQDYFLYPPPLIPLLEIAARLPFTLVAVLFTTAMIASGAIGLRLLGLPWRWVVVLLAFPPLVKGVESGNVANLAFLLFAAGYRYGPTLALGSLLKVQNLIPALWLVRERRWRELLLGAGVVGAICLATLPLVGPSSWQAWVVGLEARQRTQEALPVLYGLSLGLVLPTFAFAATSIVAILAAFVLPGRRGLAGLGLASIVASPSLWPHGFLMALPAVLASASAAVAWAALGLAAGGSLGLWAMAAIGALVVVLGGWDTRLEDDPIHPLGGSVGPWAPVAGSSGMPRTSGAPSSSEASRETIRPKSAGEP